MCRLIWVLPGHTLFFFFWFCRAVTVILLVLSCCANRVQQGSFHLWTVDRYHPTVYFPLRKLSFCLFPFHLSTVPFCLLQFRLLSHFIYSSWYYGNISVVDQNVSTCSEKRKYLLDFKAYLVKICVRQSYMIYVSIQRNITELHSLMLSSISSSVFLSFLLLSLSPAELSTMPEDLEVWPYHLSFRFFTMVRRSSCTPVAFWILLRTSSFVSWSL